MPSRDFTSEDLFSSRMMSMQSSTHSSQMKTVGPAMSLRTSCWLLPQNEQYSVFLESFVPTLLIPVSVRGSSAHSSQSGADRTGMVKEQISYQYKDLVLHSPCVPQLNANPPRSMTGHSSQPCCHPTIKNSLIG